MIKIWGYLRLFFCSENIPCICNPIKLSIANSPTKQRLDFWVFFPPQLKLFSSLRKHPTFHHHYWKIYSNQSIYGRLYYKNTTNAVALEYFSKSMKTICKFGSWKIPAYILTKYLIENWYVDNRVLCQHVSHNIYFNKGNSHTSLFYTLKNKLL